MTLADRLILAAEQLNLTSEQCNGITADDMGAVADYLEALTAHGHYVSALALDAIDATSPGHPTRAAGHGMDLQNALCHANALFDAALFFAYEAQRSAAAMHQGETS